MKQRRNLLLSSTFFICWLAGSTLGQAVPPETRSAGRVVEVSFAGSRPVSRIDITAGHPNGFWTSNLPRLDNWQQIQGADVIQAIKFLAQLAGDKAEITIFALKGKRFGEITEPIGSYTIGLGESVNVGEMKRFGFEPFTLKLTAADPMMAYMPNVDNPSRSLWVSVSPVESALPAFGLKFRNDTSKAILAIAFHSEAKGRPILSGMPQGQYGKPLMAPGGEYDTVMKTNGHDDIRVVVDAVIYEDSSIEGDEAKGATFLAYRQGRKAALKKLMSILRTASYSNGKLELAALIGRIDSEATVPQNNANRVPGSLASQERVAFEGVVKEMLVALRKLGSMDDLSPAEVQRMFEEFVQFNQDWLDRLSK